MLVGTVQFGEADSSKTESHTDAQMTQLGAATSGLIIARVWFVSFSLFVYADASRCRAAASCSFCFVFCVVLFSTGIILVAKPIRPIFENITSIMINKGRYNNFNTICVFKLVI